MGNIDMGKAVNLLISQAKTLEKNVNRALGDTATQEHSRYVSFKVFASRYNDIARETEKLFGLPYGSFSVYKVDEMKSYADTVWPTQKQVVESVGLEIGTLLTYLESSVVENPIMNTTKKKLLSDYAKIKKSCSGNMAITIPEGE